MKLHIQITKNPLKHQNINYKRT